METTNKITVRGELALALAVLVNSFAVAMTVYAGLIKNWLRAEEPAPPEVIAQRTYRLIHNAMRGLCPGVEA